MSPKSATARELSSELGGQETGGNEVTEEKIGQEGEVPELLDEVETNPSPVLSVEDLEALIEEADKVAESSSLTMAEVDKLMSERVTQTESLVRAKERRVNFLAVVDGYDPLQDITSEDYERLAKERVIETKLAQTLEKLDSSIDRLKGKAYLTVEAVSELGKLKTARDAYRQNIESSIAEHREAIDAKKVATRAQVLEHYGRRVKELEASLEEINNNPQVIERVQEENRRQRERWEKEQLEARAEIVKEASRYMQSITNRLDTKARRLDEISGEEDVVTKLTALLSQRKTQQNNKETQSAIDSSRNAIRAQIEKAINEGEGSGRINDIKEIAPWMKAKNGQTISYAEAVGYLRDKETKKALKAQAELGDATAQKILSELDDLRLKEQAFGLIVGEKDKKDKDGKTYVDKLFNLIGERRRKDKEEIERLRAEAEEKAREAREAFEKSAESILAKGGFIVECPVYEKDARGKRIEVGREDGAVLLVRTTSKKGNPIVVVREILGATNGLSVDQASPPDLSSFPHWLQEQAKRNSIPEEK